MEKRITWLKGFIKFVFGQFGKKHASAMSAELTLNSMLALVPMMTVAVSLMAIFPAFDDLNKQVQDLIFNNFLPETGLAVQTYLDEYVAKSRKLPAIGLTFLLITALMLMRSIDKGINTIWETGSKRKGIQKWLAYWAMLTMAPILIATSLLVTSYFAALPIVEQFSGVLIIGLPFILIVFAFTALFIITPAATVRFKYALIASVITAIFFETAKYAFAIFVTKFSTYELIYGAITAIPLFFLWVFFSWLIVLLGSTICYGLHRYEQGHEKQANDFVAALTILKFFVEAQLAESSVSVEQLKSKFSQTHERTLRLQVQKLLELNLLCKLENEDYCLKVNAKELTLAEVYRRGDWRLPNNKQLTDDEGYAEFNQLIEQANSKVDLALGAGFLDAKSVDTKL